MYWSISLQYLQTLTIVYLFFYTIFYQNSLNKYKKAHWHWNTAILYKCTLYCFSRCVLVYLTVLLGHVFLYMYNKSAEKSDHNDCV